MKQRTRYNKIGHTHVLSTKRKKKTKKRKEKSLESSLERTNVVVLAFWRSRFMGNK